MATAENEYDFIFIGSGMGCLLVILTGGLFLIVWLLGEFVNMFGRYRCQVCGRKN